MTEVKNYFLNNLENLEKELIQDIENNKDSKLLFHKNILEVKKNEFKKDKNNLKKLKELAE